MHEHREKADTKPDRAETIPFAARPGNPSTIRVVPQNQGESQSAPPRTCRSLCFRSRTKCRLHAQKIRPLSDPNRARAIIPAVPPRNARYPPAFRAGRTSAGSRWGSPRRLDRRENALRRERDLRDPDADRIFDCIGDRRRDAEHAALAYAFSAERAGAALLEDERLVAMRQVTGERHAVGERRCVRRRDAVVAQLLEKALPEGLQCWRGPDAAAPRLQREYRGRFRRGATDFGLRRCERDSSPEQAPSLHARPRSPANPGDADGFNRHKRCELHIKIRRKSLQKQRLTTRRPTRYTSCAGQYSRCLR